MSKRIILSFAAAAAVVLLAAAPALPVTFIQVARPNGGETIELGSRQLFEWNTDANGTVQIDLLKGGAIVRTLTPSGGAINSGQTVLIFPDDVAPDDDYQVRIRSLQNPAASDTSDQPFTVVAGPFFVINAPVLGQVWPVTSTQTILWTSNPNVLNVSIALMQNDTAVMLIAPSTFDDGSFEWVVPPEVVPASNYRIRISDSFNPAVFTDSDLFTISAFAPLAVLFPDGGEFLPAGSIQTIRWTGLEGQPVDIDLLRGDTLERAITADFVSADNTLQWLVPTNTTSGADYRIRVSSSADPGAFDFSDTFFTILPPGQGVTVLFPNGAETLTAGTTRNILWEGAAGQPVRIELLRGGALDTVIATSFTSSQGTFPWAIPADQAESSSYRIRVRLVNQPGVFDESNTDFTIAAGAPPGPSVTVITPNGGEAWQAGTTQSIVWTSSEITGSVRVQLLKGGALEETIVASTPNDGLFIWSIPTGQQEGNDYRVRITSLGTNPVSDETDGFFSIAAAEGPDLSNIGVAPSIIRAGLDDTITVTLTADASATGQTVEGGEIFIDRDPGLSRGIPLEAADGAFDSAVEVLTGTIDVSAVEPPQARLGIRARSSDGTWSPTVIVLLSVIQPTGPARVVDLGVSPVAGITVVPSTVTSAPPATAESPAANLVSDETGGFFQTLGTPAADPVVVVEDLGAVLPLTGVTLSPGPDVVLFPSDFTVETSVDGVDFTPAAAMTGFRTRGDAITLQFRETQARFVRLTATPQLDRADNSFTAQIGRFRPVTVRGVPEATITFTTPAVGEGPLSEFDLRFGTRPISTNNFDLAVQATGLPAPPAPGETVTATVALPGASGRTFLAVRTIDTNDTVSQVSNAAVLDASPAGFGLTAPAEISAAPIDAPVSFAFSQDPTARRGFIQFSNAAGFPPAPVEVSGTVERTVSVPLRAGQTQMTPTAAQWRQVQLLAGDDGIVFWRLQGVSPQQGILVSPVRTLTFDAGTIVGVGARQQPGGVATTTLEPERALPPTFVWSDMTGGISRFVVDVSTDATVPVPDRRRTLTFGGRGISGEEVRLTDREWLLVRRLAATAEDGQIFLRVRATSASGVFTASSDIVAMTVDGGDWTVSDLDLSTLPTEVNWTNTSTGITQFSVEFSVTDQFNRTARETLRAPSRPVTGTSLVINEAAARRLALLAERNGTATLFYRIRGEDADRAFVTFSPAQQTAAP